MGHLQFFATVVSPEYLKGGWAEGYQVACNLQFYCKMPLHPSHWTFTCIACQVNALHTKLHKAHTCSRGCDHLGFAASSVTFGGVRCHSHRVGSLRKQTCNNSLLCGGETQRRWKKGVKETERKRDDIWINIWVEPMISVEMACCLPAFCTRHSAALVPISQMLTTSSTFPSVSY